MRITVGSVNKPQDLRNPWNYDERREMLRAALDEMGLISDIVPVPDIDDSPNWVKHAEAYHEGPGPLPLTSLLRNCTQILAGRLRFWNTMTEKI